MDAASWIYPIYCHRILRYLQNNLHTMHLQYLNFIPIISPAVLNRGFHCEIHDYTIKKYSSVNNNRISFNGYKSLLNILEFWERFIHLRLVVKFAVRWFDSFCYIGTLEKKFHFDLSNYPLSMNCKLSEIHSYSMVNICTYSLFLFQVLSNFSSEGTTTSSVGMFPS